MICLAIAGKPAHTIAPGISSYRVKRLLTISSLLLCLGLPAHGQSDTPAPFDNDLQRLGEIMGALHYLRAICGANEGQKTHCGDNRFQCVMNLEAFQAKTKSLPVSAFQPLTASSVGVR